MVEKKKGKERGIVWSNENICLSSNFSSFLWLRGWRLTPGFMWRGMHLAHDSDDSDDWCGIRSSFDCSLSSHPLLLMQRLLLWWDKEVINCSADNNAVSPASDLRPQSHRDWDTGSWLSASHITSHVRLWGEKASDPPLVASHHMSFLFTSKRWAHDERRTRQVNKEWNKRTEQQTHRGLRTVDDEEEKERDGVDTRSLDPRRRRLVSPNHATSDSVSLSHSVSQEATEKKRKCIDAWDVLPENQKINVADTRDSRRRLELMFPRKMSRLFLSSCLPWGKKEGSNLNRGSCESVTQITISSSN